MQDHTLDPLATLGVLHLRRLRQLHGFAGWTIRHASLLSDQFSPAREPPPELVSGASRSTRRRSRRAPASLAGFTVTATGSSTVGFRPAFVNWTTVTANADLMLDVVGDLVRRFLWAKVGLF